MGFGLGSSVGRFAAGILACLLATPSARGAEGRTNTVEQQPSRAGQGSSVRSRCATDSKWRLWLLLPCSLPVAIAFDENARLWVCENPEYLTALDKHAVMGKIRMLEDTDHDGIFDANTLVADNLMFPSGIACYNGGVVVATAQELVFIKEGQRRVLLSGFAFPTNAPAPLPCVNSLAWGINGRIYCCAAELAAGLSSSVGPGMPGAALGRNDFSLDPRSGALVAEAGPSDSGEAFDLAGRRIVADLNRPARQSMYALSYAARNLYFPHPAELSDVLPPADRVFHFDTVTMARTNQPRGGVPLTNVLRADYGTSYRGLCVYNGSAFPSEYLNNLFIPATSQHAIRRAVLRTVGVEVIGERPPDERDREFLASRDGNFNPVQVINSAEGAIYVADFQGGKDSGRILRIVPDTFKQSKAAPQMSKAATKDLVVALSSANGWHRDTAARLLYERQDPVAPSLLTNVVQHSQIARARYHALYALGTQNALTDAVLLRGLRDSDELVRAAAVRLCEASIRTRPLTDMVWTQLKTMPTDHSLLVRYQLALSAGNIDRPERTDVSIALLNADPGNAWVRFAVMSSLASGGTRALTALANNPAWRNDVQSLAVLKDMATMIGVQGHEDEAMALLDYLQNSRLDLRTAFTLCSGFGMGLRQSGSALGLIDPKIRLERIYNQAVAVTLNDATPPDLRVAAIECRAVSPNPVTGIDDLSQVILASQQPSNVLAATVATLGTMDTPDVFYGALSQTGLLAPAQRQNIAAAMLRRGFRLHEALGSLESGLLTVADFNTAQLNLLRTFLDPSVSQHAVKLLGPYQPFRQEVLRQYARAATLPGDANRGRALFAQRCASCHHLSGIGNQVGPDLVSRRTMGREAILSAILQPSAEIAPHHNTAVVISKEGDVYMGVLRNENEACVTVVEPGGRAVVIPRTNIDRLQPQPWSLMPDGLEQNLNVQGVADIIEFIVLAPWVRPP